jgi:cytochrome c-type biogenesis protein CcmH
MTTLRLPISSVLALGLLLILFVPNGASAQVDTFAFETEEQQQRFRHLSNVLRCPMCQNTNLSGSSGGTAEDLRREIHAMIIDGWTNEEIEQFMYDRYGDFIFYQPRLRAETILLWFGPLLFLLIGGLIAFSVWRRAKSYEDKSADLDEEQQDRLRKLLDDKPL